MREKRQKGVYVYRGAMKSLQEMRNAGGLEKRARKFDRKLSAKRKEMLGEMTKDEKTERKFDIRGYLQGGGGIFIGTW